MKTTYNKILKYKPCKEGLVLAKPEWVKNPDMAIDFKEILEVAGIKNTFWCLQTQEYKSYCLILADIAETVLYIYEKAYPDDSRVRDSIENIRRYSRGEISLKELETAWAAAWAAARAAARDAQWKKNEEILRRYL